MSQILTKIIQEQIENVAFDASKTAKEIKSKIAHLKELPFKRFVDNNGKKIWFFGNVIDSYKIKFYVINDNKNLWRAKLIVDWKEETQTPTIVYGKDIDKNFGPFNTLDELGMGLNHKLKNNLLMNTEIYHDDWKLNMDKEVVILLKKLQEIGEQIVNLEDNHLKELKKMYSDIQHFTEEQLLKYSQRKAPEEKDKQALIFRPSKYE